VHAAARARGGEDEDAARVDELCGLREVALEEEVERGEVLVGRCVGEWE
jgi:hypothetical protein